MSIYDDEELINKYLDDELTDEELAAFNKRRENDPVFNDMVNDFIETENVIEKTALYINQKKQDDFLGEYEKFLEEQKKLIEENKTTIPKREEAHSEASQHNTPVIPIAKKSGLKYSLAAIAAACIAIASWLIPQYTNVRVVPLISENTVKEKYISKDKLGKEIFTKAMVDSGYVKKSEIAEKFKETQEFKDNYFEKNSVEDRYVLRSIYDNLTEKLEFTQRMVFTEFMIKHIFSIVASSKGQDDYFLPFFKFNENNKTKIKLHSSIKLENKESDRHYSVIILNNVDIVYHFNLEYNKPQNLKFDSTGVYLIKIEAFQKNKKEPFDKTVRVFFVE